MNREPIETPTSAFTDGPLSRDIDALVEYVGKTRNLGARAARRYVGRHLTQTTLAWWRATGRFPIGFRNPDPQFHDDAGQLLRRAQSKRVAR